MKYNVLIYYIDYKFPITRLGKLMRASTIQVMMNLILILRMVSCLMMFSKQAILTFCDEFVPGDPPEYFFDKNPENFPAILELHRSVG